MCHSRVILVLHSCAESPCCSRRAGSTIVSCLWRTYFPLATRRSIFRSRWKSKNVERWSYIYTPITVTLQFKLLTIQNYSHLHQLNSVRPKLTAFFQCCSALGRPWLGFGKTDGQLCDHVGALR